MKILNDITGCVEKSVKFYDKSLTKRLFLKIINLHSCNKVTTTQIQIEMDSSQILAMINLTPIISRAKSKWYKSKKVKKLVLNSHC